MERFPRGTLPPSAFEAIATVAPKAIARRPPRTVEAAAAAAAAATAPEADQPEPEHESEHDLSTTCPSCGTEMRPEHAHYRCPACGYRDSCCF